MPQLSGLQIFAGFSLAAVLAGSAPAGVRPQPISLDTATSLPITQVLVFGKNSRRSAEDFATEQKASVKDVKRAHAASGLIECGDAHGAGQLTLVGNVVT